MQRILVLNGPNLDLLGTREPHIYGSRSFEDYLAELRGAFPQATFAYRQSNVEGELINAIQEQGTAAYGIILNPGGYTHTSVALGDAISSIAVPVIEVHISNVAAREDFRKISHVSAKCKGTITGLGLKGYELAIRFFLQ